jgi:hypothetical protein
MGWLYFFPFFLRCPQGVRGCRNLQKIGTNDITSSIPPSPPRSPSHLSFLTPSALSSSCSLSLAFIHPFLISHLIPKQLPKILQTEEQIPRALDVLDRKLRGLGRPVNRTKKRIAEHRLPGLVVQGKAIFLVTERVRGKQDRRRGFERLR